MSSGMSSGMFLGSILNLWHAVSERIVCHGNRAILELVVSKQAHCLLCLPRIVGTVVDFVESLIDYDLEIDTPY